MFEAKLPCRSKCRLKTSCAPRYCLML